MKIDLIFIMFLVLIVYPVYFSYRIWRLNYRIDHAVESLTGMIAEIMKGENKDETE